MLTTTLIESKVAYVTKIGREKANFVTVIGVSGPAGPRGEDGKNAPALGISSDSGNLIIEGSDGGKLVEASSIIAIAAEQDSVQVYDYDAIVATNLGV